jgi:archaemetzincin
LLLCFWGCHPGPSKVRRIGIEPIDFADARQLRFLQGQLATFFHCPVYVLSLTAKPPAFLDLSKGERYSADSVLRWLSGRRPDSLSILVGVTGNDIFTNKPNKPVWGILGLGNCPGTACVVSDARFAGSAPEKYRHRLRTLVIHEIGHNLGLPHCKSPHCIMNDANEQIATVDSSGDDYCAACRRRLEAF